MSEPALDTAVGTAQHGRTRPHGSRGFKGVLSEEKPKTNFSGSIEPPDYQTDSGSDFALRGERAIEPLTTKKSYKKTEVFSKKIQKKLKGQTDHKFLGK